MAKRARKPAQKVQAYADRNGEPPPVLPRPTSRRASWEAAQAIGRAAAEARRKASALEFEAVCAGREAGFSWDMIGEAMSLSGETLRRRYADAVSEVDARVQP